MADFSVQYRNGTVTHYSGDAAHYEINPQSGVLTVFDGEGNRLHFSNAGWLGVTEAAPVSVYDTHPKA
jgi:hypothetical protein